MTVTVSPMWTRSRTAMFLYSSVCQSATKLTLMLSLTVQPSLFATYCCARVLSCDSVGASSHALDRSTAFTRSYANASRCSDQTTFSVRVTIVPSLFVQNGTMPVYALVMSESRTSSVMFFP